MTDDEKLIWVLANALEDIMADLNRKISSHGAMVLSRECDFLSSQIKELQGKQCP
jgi:hypothetical protein